MELRGVGDRWMAGETVDGVTFGHGAAVEVVAGAHAGARGRVLLLLSVRPEPRYLVRISAPSVDARLAQSMLAPVGAS